MDREINNNSKKFLILILIVCVAFLVLIINAFEYLPNKSGDEIINRTNVEEINKAAEPVETEEAKEQPKEERGTLNINLDQPTKVEEPEKLEPIAVDGDNAVAEDAKPVELTPEQKADEAFRTAKAYRHSKQYVKALEEYQKIPMITKDNDTIARSYEEIAFIYATVKRYGTALSFAQKAYNMSPSSSREVLLARLYYKTGDMDKATTRINNVLQRDFSADR